MDHAPCGLVGLETAFGVVVSELVRPKYLTWPQVAERMSAAPAKIVGLSTKGAIKEGLDADLVIVDPDKEWVVKREDFISKAVNSPFVGRKLIGAVEYTISHGNLVYSA